MTHIAKLSKNLTTNVSSNYRAHGKIGDDRKRRFARRDDRNASSDYFYRRQEELWTDPEDKSLNLAT